MGFHVIVERIFDSSLSCKYSYSSYFKDGYHKGILEIIKETGEVNIIQPMEEDTKNQRFIRASIKLKKSWKEGVLPEKVEWAS